MRFNPPHTILRYNMDFSHFLLRLLIRGILECIMIDNKTLIFFSWLLIIKRVLSQDQRLIANDSMDTIKVNLRDTSFFCFFLRYSSKFTIEVSVAQEWNQTEGRKHQTSAPPPHSEKIKQIMKIYTKLYTGYDGLQTLLRRRLFTNSHVFTILDSPTKLL